MSQGYDRLAGIPPGIRISVEPPVHPADTRHIRVGLSLGYRRVIPLAEERHRQAKMCIRDRAGNGQIMLDVAYQMFAQGKNKLELTALHLTVGSDVNPLHTDNFEEVSFGPILYGAKKLGIQIPVSYTHLDVYKRQAH